jgi:hypothetical protein
MACTHIILNIPISDENYRRENINYFNTISHMMQTTHYFDWLAFLLYVQEILHVSLGSEMN